VRRIGSVTALDSASIISALAGEASLRPFVADGTISTLPARRARLRLLLDVVAQGFEPGVRYTERVVSEFLATLHPDYAALRRYLVDEGFLSRANGEYWRSGGTVPVAQAPEPGPPSR
jgi:hypothetical protein